MWSRSVDSSLRPPSGINTLLIGLTSLLLAGFLCACGDDSGSESNSANPDAGDSDSDSYDDMEVTWSSLSERPCPDDSPLTYENFGQAFMLNWCTGCHAAGLEDSERAMAPVGIDLDTKEDMTSHAARIWARSADLNTTMPPAGGPDEIERWMLGEWLACGAP